jgi:Peptidase C39 family
MSGVEPCVRSARPEGSAAAALASVAQFHGLPIEAAEVAPLVGFPSVRELGELVVASRLIGFDSVPLEGGYDELPEVARPNLVRFRDRFVVLYDIDPEKTRVGDPLHGPTTLTRADFSALWTGDCLQLTPVNLDAARAKLAEHRRWWRRLSSPRALGFAGGVALLTALVAWRGAGGMPELALAAPLALAAAASLWLVLFRASCAQCGRAHQLAGALPLDRIGAIFYTALLIAPPLVSGALLWPAAGAHLGLLGILTREAILCVPCLIAALGAWLALHAASSSLPALAGELLFLGAAAAAFLAVPRFRRAACARSLTLARELAKEAQRQQLPPGGVRVTVWKRAGCTACLFYEAIFKPALLQDYEGVVAIDERDASRLAIATPLILVAGNSSTLIVSLPGSDGDYQILQEAVEKARAPSPTGDLIVVGKVCAD